MSDDSNSKDGPSSRSGDMGNDAEGVWSPDIEQSFQEALAIYPPCGRRKIILSDEGKMYGRNELIARYIKLRTGKTRTRKQVSSHIQVLARRKAREVQAKIKLGGDSGGNGGGGGKGPAPPTSANLAIWDSAVKEKAHQILSSQLANATALHAGKPGLVAPTPAPGYPGPPFWQTSLGPAGPSDIDVKPFVSSTDSTGAYPGPPPSKDVAGALMTTGAGAPNGTTGDPWEGRSISTSKLRLVEFSAFMEHPSSLILPNGPTSHPITHLFVHIGGPPSFSDPPLESIDVRQIYDKFPEKKGGLKELFDRGPQDAFFLVKFWADLNTGPLPDDPNTFYGVSSLYESSENMTITCSTKVCSFGKQVVEKVETEYARFENGRFVYRIQRSAMCEYMVNFIHKLKNLPEKYMMNSVLENFTILQVVTNRETNETLLCTAYVFEVSTSVHGAQHHIYRLVKD